MQKSVVNIITFIRGCEPRSDVDLLLPIEKQLEKLRELKLPATFLLQYDALTPPFLGLFQKENGTTLETGVWLEIVEPLCRDCGIPWRGRYPWDWFANVGFSVGYSPKEREKLVDCLFAKYKEIFGEYPRVMGSWMIDAHTLAYAQNTYGLDAVCICKEQWGTDGYTLWGGFYDKAYYPAKRNALCPAGSLEQQIDVPVFRMLGADPIFQYDCGLDLQSGAPDMQQVYTLEPVYCGTGGGGDPAWVDWFLKTTFEGLSFPFAYAQAGQENSFGWPEMEKGICDQFSKFASLRAQNKLSLLTLGETGRNFKKEFRQTPPSATVTEGDWKGQDKDSFRYCCKSYRAELFSENGRYFFRDVYAFSDRYCERYLNGIDEEKSLVYDNLPVIDGNRGSKNGIRAGLFFEKGNEEVHFSKAEAREEAGGVLAVTLSSQNERVQVRFLPVGICFALSNGLVLSEKHGSYRGLIDVKAQSETSLTLCHEGFDYRVKLKTGRFSFENGIRLLPEENKIEVCFK